MFMFILLLFYSYIYHLFPFLREEENRERERERRIKSRIIINRKWIDDDSTRLVASETLLNCLTNYN